MIKKIDLGYGEEWNVIDEKNYFRTKNFTFFKKPVQNTQEATVKIQVSEELLNNPAVPKFGVIDALVDDYRKFLFEHFGYSPKVTAKKEKSEIKTPCFQCGDKIEWDENVVLLINTQASSNNLSYIGDFTEENNYEYGEHVFPFHKECFLDTAGNYYEHNYHRKRKIP